MSEGSLVVPGHRGGLQPSSERLVFKAAVGGYDAKVGKALLHGDPE